VHTSAGKTHEIKYKYIGSRRPRTMVVAGDASTSAYRNVENQLLVQINGFSIVARKNFSI
jgi:hypothetical protein